MSTLTQPQVESVVRLLIAAVFQDKLVTILENDRLAERLKQLPWDSGTPPDLYAKGETAAVRDALATPAGRKALLRADAALFPDAESQRYLLSQIQRVLDSDTLASEEQQFIDDLKAAFPK